MKKLCIIAASVFLLGCVVNGNAFAADKVLFSFENDAEGWEIPEWSLEKDDHVTQSIEVSDGVANEGKGSLKVNVGFPGKRWTAAIVEVAEYFDWSNYKEVSCDIYLPKDAPEGLKAKIILTVGEDWVFTEMSRSKKLAPGEWTTIKASLEDGSTDFRKTVVDETFRSDVRKIDIRIESNRKPAYTGSLYVDNVKIASK